MKRKRSQPAGNTPILWPIVKHSLLQPVASFFFPSPQDRVDIIVGQSHRLNQLIEQAFTIMLRFSLVVFCVALIVGSYTLQAEGASEVLRFFIAGAGFIAILAFVRRINFVYRVRGFLAVLYLIALVEIANFGYSVEAFVFFMTLIALGVLLQGFRGGLLIAAFSTVTVAVFGWQIAQGNYQPLVIPPGAATSPSTVEAGLAALNVFIGGATVLLATVALLLRSVNTAWQEEEEAKSLLREERDRLDQRIGERTREVRKRELILEAVAFSSAELLQSDGWRETASTILAKLGEATGASRVYLFEKHQDSAGKELLVSQRYEWVAAGVAPQIDNPGLQNTPANELLARWVAVFEQGKFVSGLVKDLPLSERLMLEAQQIVSILVMPIMVDKRWWGFLGFDECNGERIWTAAEVEALVVAANNFGGALQRQRREDQLKENEAILQVYAEQLATARDQALASSRYKSLLLRKVNHELRTPLTAILGYAEMLNDGVAGKLLSEQEHFAQQIIASSVHLAGLIDDLLDQAKIEQGTLTITEKPFALADMLNFLKDLLVRAAQAKGLTFSLHCSPDMPDQLVGDEQRLRQIIINLANNAIKFTAQGSVRLDIEPAPERGWRIIVQDTGSGILPEVQDKIFDSFWQADSSASSPHKGYGLGLSVVQQLVDLMGGHIEVLSEVDRGSTFTVWLPFSTPSTQAVLSGLPASQRRPQRTGETD